MVTDGYGYWLTWLERIGQLDPASTPVSRANRERVQAYAEAAALRLAVSVQTRVNDLSRSLHVGMVLALLGHTTLALSEKHYNQSRMVDASGRNNGAMGQVRQAMLELLR